MSVIQDDIHHDSSPLYLHNHPSSEDNPSSAVMKKQAKEVRKNNTGDKGGETSAVSNENHIKVSILPHHGGDEERCCTLHWYM